jgi:hypothetical protein
MSTESTNPSSDELKQSCNQRLSRAQFLELVTGRAIKAGTIAAGIIIADAFVAPPRTAAASGGTSIGLYGPGAAIAAPPSDFASYGPGAAIGEIL